LNELLLPWKSNNACGFLSLSDAQKDIATNWISNWKNAGPVIYFQNFAIVIAEKSTIYRKKKTASNR